LIKDENNIIVKIIKYCLLTVFIIVPLIINYSNEKDKKERLDEAIMLDNCMIISKNDIIYGEYDNEYIRIITNTNQFYNIEDRPFAASIKSNITDYFRRKEFMLNNLPVNNKSVIDKIFNYTDATIIIIPYEGTYFNTVTCGNKLVIYR
jgi:hypothetical protein